MERNHHRQHGFAKKVLKKFSIILDRFQYLEIQKKQQLATAMVVVIILPTIQVVTNMNRTKKKLMENEMKVGETQHQTRF
jgi:hypothetical protein